MIFLHLKIVVFLIINSSFNISGNSDCFNGYSLGDFSGKTLPLSSAGQEKNVFKSFGGTVEDYAKLTSLL